MFNATTDRIKQLSEFYPSKIEELENIFLDKTNIYIDRSNVLYRQNKL